MVKTPPCPRPAENVSTHLWLNLLDSYEISWQKVNFYVVVQRRQKKYQSLS